MQMRQLNGVNRQLPTGGTHAFTLTASCLHLSVVSYGWGWRGEGAHRGRCRLPHPAELLHCGSSQKRTAVVSRTLQCWLSCALACVCLDVNQGVHFIVFQQGVKELGWCFFLSLPSSVCVSGLPVLKNCFTRCSSVLFYCFFVLSVFNNCLYSRIPCAPPVCENLWCI